MLIKFEVKTELPIFRLSGLLERPEQVLEAVRGERRLTKNPHDFKDWSANLEAVLDDGSEAVGDDGNVNLYAHCVLGFSPESLDLEMLLDPFEKQLHLPPIFIEESDVLGSKIEVVRVVNEAALEFRGIVDNPSDSPRILLPVLLLGEADALVFEYIVGTVKDAFPVDNLIGRLTLLPDDEECPKRIDAVETGEVEVASVKHIAGQRLVCEPVHRVDVMYLGVGDSVEHGNLRDNVNLGVDSDARLCTSELRPSEYGHAEVDGCGVDGIESAVQFKLLRDASGLGNGHHVEGKLLKDTMVSEGIGLRQHLPVDRQVSKAEVLGFLSMGGSYICEFPEASATNELAKHQNQQMVPVRHRPAFGSVVVLGEYSPKLSLGEELYYLCKNEYPCMHICSDFDSDAKVSISKPGQGIEWIKRCA